MYLKTELYDLIKTDESIFDFIQDGSLDGLWYWDLENPENEWINAKFWKVLGYNPDEMPHKSSAWQSIINQEDLEVANENFIKHCENPNYPYDQIVRYTHKDGSTVWIRCRGLAIRDCSGKPIRMLGAHQDVTELKIRQQELQKTKEKAEENEAKISALFSSMSEMIVLHELVFDENGNPANYRITDCNDAFTKITGISRNAAIGRLSTEVFGAEQPPYLKEYSEVALTGKSYHFEVYFQPMEKHFSIAVISPKKNHFATLTTDITERKKAAQELIVSENRFRQVADTAQEWIWEVDTNGLYTYASPILELMLGYTPDEVIGKKYFYDLFTPEKRVELKKAAFEVFGKKEVFRDFQNLLLHKNGQLVIASTSGSPVFDEVGNFIGYRGVDQDITERIHKEEELLDSKKLLEQIINNSPVRIFWKDKNLSYLGCNNAFAKDAGFSAPKDIIGRNDYQMGWFNQADIYRNDDREVIESGKSKLNIEEPQTTPDGKEKFLLTNKIPLTNSDGKPEGVLGIYLDITQRKKTEHLLAEKSEEIAVQNRELNQANNQLIGAKEKAEESEKQLSAMINAVPDLIFRINTEGVFLNYKADIIDLYYNADTLIGKNYKDIMPDNIVDILNKKIEATIHKDEIQIFEYTLELPEKGKNTYEARMTKSGENEVTTIVRNITESKLVEEKLKESELKYRSLIESSSDAIFCVNEKGEYKFTNLLFASTFGKSPQYFVGKTFWDVYDKEQADYRYEATKRLFESGESETLEVEVPLPDKSLYFLATTNPIKDELGNVLLNLTHATDITKLKKGEEELIKAKQKAEESDKLKTAFLQNMSHEIRTPLNGILGFASLLQDEDLEKEEIKQFTAIISQSGQRLLEIINNVLDISKIETGQMPVNQDEFSLNSMISKLFSFFSPFAKAKNIKLYSKSSLDNSDGQIISDETKLNQILTNLINNAVKFTSEGSIDFGYEMENEELLFYVKDTGMGIPPDYQNIIFDRFTQVDSTITRGFEGAGLGLAISKGLVEMLGGKIWLETELGKGTTFFFTIPYEFSASEVTEIKQIETQNKLTREIKILIAEDDYKSYLYLSETLKKIGFSLMQVENGLMAVDCVKNNPDIDLVLMDIRMPVMDGFEAIKQIKAIRPDLPVIAQTAYSFLEEKKKILSLGFNDYLSKPIESEKLLELIMKYID